MAAKAVCPECKGLKQGRGFAHKPGCSKAVRKGKGTGERKAALLARLSDAEKETAKKLAGQHTADVLRYAASIAKRPPVRVATATLFEILQKAGLSADKVAEVRAAITNA